ncbi:MAG: hypothetical protein IJS22_09675 [Lachnospiraceae bacterium]|nr:hypothetical protein [Lachnospiraceae bacterium]
MIDECNWYTTTSKKEKTKEIEEIIRHIEKEEYDFLNVQIKKIKSIFIKHLNDQEFDTIIILTILSERKHICQKKELIMFCLRKTSGYVDKVIYRLKRLSDECILL